LSRTQENAFDKNVPVLSDERRILSAVRLISGSFVSQNLACLQSSLVECSGLSGATARSSWKDRAVTVYSMTALDSNVCSVFSSGILVITCVFPSDLFSMRGLGVARRTEKDWFEVGAAIITSSFPPTNLTLEVFVTLVSSEAWNRSGDTQHYATIEQ